MDVVAAAEDFWKAAGGRSRFGSPVDIGAAAAAGYRVSVVEVPGLNTTAAGRIGSSDTAWFCGPARRLRGCLLADVGHALILVDAGDPDDERRFTVAHEISHLLYHYLRPRELALREFGGAFSAVLDRTRPPSMAELLSSAIRNIPLDPFRHAMDRNARSKRSVDAMEDQADDLAVELLAPWKELRTMRGAAPGEIRARFGLPAPVAARVAGLISLPKTTIGVLTMFGPK